MSKIISLLFLLVLTITGKTQIQKIDLQASGLTCSMCNKSIYKSLITVNNILKVESDLNTNTFTLFFKESDKINIDELKNKVELAGYKVANLWIYMQTTPLDIKNDTHTLLENNHYHFMDVKAQQLSGLVKLHVLDKGFLTAKLNKAYEKKTGMKCFKTGYMEDCCVPGSKEKQRIYHVTL